jgi:hypothetical protein
MGETERSLHQLTLLNILVLQLQGYYRSSHWNPLAGIYLHWRSMVSKTRYSWREGKTRPETSGSHYFISYARIDWSIHLFLRCKMLKIKSTEDGIPDFTSPYLVRKTTAIGFIPVHKEISEDDASLFSTTIMSVWIQSGEARLFFK